jgi:hypothetical protein
MTALLTVWTALGTLTAAAKLTRRPVHPPRFATDMRISHVLSVHLIAYCIFCVNSDISTTLVMRGLPCVRGAALRACVLGTTTTMESSGEVDAAQPSHPRNKHFFTACQRVCALAK